MRNLLNTAMFMLAIAVIVYVENHGLDDSARRLGEVVRAFLDALNR